MDTSSSLCCPTPFTRLGSFKSFLNPKIGQLSPRRLHTASRFVARRNHVPDGDDWCYGGRSVDEDLIVLRKRIHEIKMMERNFEPPAYWMDWEKRYYKFYNTDVCELLGLLQNLMMNTRPSLAIGMVVLAATSVPISMFIILFHLIEMTKGFLSSI